MTIGLLMAEAGFGQRPAPMFTSKLYVADTSGTAELISPTQIEALNRKSVHNAQGITISTQANSTNAIVFSNGTGVYFAGDTRMQVVKFQQNGFFPDRVELENEPSVSAIEIFIPNGTLSVSTPRMTAGSSMTFTTPHSVVSLHGGTTIIEVDDFETRISVVEGSVTVGQHTTLSAGALLTHGMQAVAREQPDSSPYLSVQEIPVAARTFINQMADASQLTRQSVYFEVRIPVAGDFYGADDATETAATEELDSSGNDNPAASPQNLVAGTTSPVQSTSATQPSFANAFAPPTAGNSNSTNPIDVLVPIELTPTSPIAEVVVSVSRITQ